MPVLLKEVGSGISRSDRTRRSASSPWRASRRPASAGPRGRRWRACAPPSRRGAAWASSSRAGGSRPPRASSPAARALRRPGGHRVGRHPQRDRDREGARAGRRRGRARAAAPARRRAVGSEAVAEELARLVAELRLAMFLTGCTRVSELRARTLSPRARPHGVRHDRAVRQGARAPEGGARGGGGPLRRDRRGRRDRRARRRDRAVPARPPRPRPRARTTSPAGS